MTPAEWLQGDATFTTTIMTLLTDKWGGMGFTAWDPITVQMQLRDDFDIAEPKDHLLERIGAGSSLFQSNLFFVSLPAFNSTCTTLNRDMSFSDIYVPSGLDDILWGIWEARMLLGKELWAENEFSHDIARYVGLLLVNHGFTEPPELLAFAEMDEHAAKNVADLASEISTEDTEMFEARYESIQETHDALQEHTANNMQELQQQLRDLYPSLQASDKRLA